MVQFQNSDMVAAGYRGPVAALQAQLSALSQALGTWARREDTRGPDASQIRAGHIGVAAIDDMTAVLHKVRQQLVTELRADEDERARRVDQMISEAWRSGEGQVTP
jgi:hypothetical protein